jgi:hypothetical protein
MARSFEKGSGLAFSLFLAKPQVMSARADQIGWEPTSNQQRIAAGRADRDGHKIGLRVRALLGGWLAEARVVL